MLGDLAYRIDRPFFASWSGSKSGNPDHLLEQIDLGAGRHGVVSATDGPPSPRPAMFYLTGIRSSLTVSQEDGFAALDFPGAAWASRQTLGERDDQSPAQGCDRVWDVAFGSDRGRLWVDDRREAQAPGGERRHEIPRGESIRARRSGSRKRRCRVWRGDESLAIPGLQNARARSLA